MDNEDLSVSFKEGKQDSFKLVTVLQIDKDGRFLDYIGPGTRYSFFSNDIVGKTVYDVIPSDIAMQFMYFLDKTLLTGENQIAEYEHVTDEVRHHYEVRFIAGGQKKILAILNDVTEFRKASAHLMHITYHDTLTNLPNRYLFADRLSQAIATAERHAKMIAILFIDLDNFKRINDTLGHKIGDQLLEAVADRLIKSTRKTDSISRMPMHEAESLVARMGGDEFVILLTDIDDYYHITKISNRIINMLSEPFSIEGHDIFMTASIGIAMYPFDGQNIDTLLMNADISMYQAKRSGRNTYQFYSKTMNSFTLEKFTMENKLWKALEQDEFRLFYQPQVNLSTGEIIGAEALIRWLQPDLLFVKPKDFLPLAEETGLIVKIGEWVLQNACSQSRFWQTQGGNPITITANVSSAQFRQDNFVDTVARILSDTGLDPLYLQLELTESTLMQDSEDTIRKLNAFRDMGIKISIDDFGTGYSSLNYLKRFPISTLKIDQSFVRDIHASQDDQSITKAIIGLAHNLNLDVIAEGVEERRQMTFLKQHGCDAIQGYLICPPLNNDSLVQFMNEKRYLKLIDRPRRNRSLPEKKGKRIPITS